MGFKERIEVIKTAAKIGGAAFSSKPAMLMQERFNQIFSPIWSLPPRRNVGQWIDMYMKSPRMNPVHKISEDVALANYKLYKGNKKDKDTWEEIIEHPLLNLLENPIPNREFTGHNLLYLTQVYLLLPSGEAFWLVERNALGVPTELWIVPPHWVLQTPTLNIPYFRVLPQGNTTYKQIYVDPNDMIWIKEPDPFNPYWRGRGRTEAIGDEIEADEYAAKYQKNFFFNDATPPVSITAPGADEPTANRLKEEWSQKYGGYRNAHKPAILPWEAKIQVLKETNKEMDFVESRKYLRDTTNQFWGIPPELFGILENSNRSTIDAAYYIYTKNVLSGRLNALDEAINRQLVPMFDKKLFIRHDNVVPDDQEFVLKQNTEGLKYGAVPVDEWRKSQGKKPLKNNKGEILYVPLNMTPYPLNESLETELQQIQEQQEQPKHFKRKSFDENKKTTIWKAFDATALKQEKNFQKAAKKYFQQQQDKLSTLFKKSAYNGTQKAENDEENNDNEEMLSIAIGLFTQEQDKLLYDTFEPLWEVSVKDGFEISNNNYDLGLDVDDYTNRFSKWVKENGLNQAKNINGTTKEKLRKTLEEGINNGESMPMLRDRISNVYTEAKTSRAENIARTETSNSVNTGTYLSFKGANIEKKEWLSSRDSRVRDSHKALDGQIKKMDETFSNGLMHPGDTSGRASDVCNCRCTLIPIFDKEE